MANVLSAIVPKSLAKGLSDLVHGKPSFEVAKIRAKVLMIDRETESIAGKEAVDGAKALRLQGRGLEARVEALTGLAMLLLDLGFKKKKIRDLVTTGEIWLGLLKVPRVPVKILFPTIVQADSSSVKVSLRITYCLPTKCSAKL